MGECRAIKGASRRSDSGRTNMPGGQPWLSAVDMTGAAVDLTQSLVTTWTRASSSESGGWWSRWVTRGTPGGLAIAHIVRLGYVATRPPSFPATGWRLVRFDHPGVVHVGEPLPRRYRRWPAIESAALRMEIAALPRLQFVTAHETLRILSELRREGYSFEDAGTP